MKGKIGNTADLEGSKDTRLQLHQCCQRLKDGQKMDKTEDLEGTKDARLQLHQFCHRSTNSLVQGTVPATAMVLQSALLLQTRLVMAQAAS